MGSVQQTLRAGLLKQHAHACMHMGIGGAFTYIVVIVILFIKVQSLFAV